jgi:hypothetical protein
MKLIWLGGRPVDADLEIKNVYTNSTRDLEINNENKENE